MHSNGALGVRAWPGDSPL